MTAPTLSTTSSDSRQEILAPLQEIFSSIQGEGIVVGKRQVFVRFAHCHLKCAYCDTPMTSATGKCHVETHPGTQLVTLVDNPMTLEVVLANIRALWSQGRHHSVSFTGGEPLLYHRFLAQLFPLMKSDRHSPMPVYLETSGTQPEFLVPVLPWVNYIAMDIKLPSATGEPDQFENHAAFYRLAASEPGCCLFIKLIFNERTSEEELEAVREIVTDRDIPLILQPETDLKTGTVQVPVSEIFRVEDTLSKTFTDVRVIPQTHKMLRVF